MTKKLILLSALLLSLISVPAKATTCDRPYLLPAADQTKRTGTINVQVLFLKFPDSGKKSKGGRFDDANLVTYYENGKLLIDESLDIIRARAITGI